MHVKAVENISTKADRIQKYRVDLLGHHRRNGIRMGFSTMLTEGARHIMGWKSPNYLYVNALNPN